MLVKNVGAYGEGYVWEVETEGAVKTYRTNLKGHGLWVCGSYEGNDARNYEDHQLEGTAQFSLVEWVTGDKIALDRAIARLEMYFNEGVE